MRRKQLGYPTRCFCCSEADLFCFELDHPVTEELDPDFKRAVCRNCHRKLEAERDIKGLTKNGRHDTSESRSAALRRYLLLLADDQEMIAEHLLANFPEMTMAELHKTAASLRRMAKALSLVDPAPNPQAS